jgi:hypothetical protein
MARRGRDVRPLFIVTSSWFRVSEGEHEDLVVGTVADGPEVVSVVTWI